MKALDDFGLLTLATMCAAFIAQQQGVALNTAFKKIPDPILDLWLTVAEFAREAWTQNIDQQFGPSSRRPRNSGAARVPSFFLECLS